MKSNSQIDIIFEDEDLVVLSKPAGLLTIPDRYKYDLPSLKTYFRAKYGDIFVVHRLDRDTSGIMLFAKNAQSHRDLSIQFENLQIKKVYHCVVEGRVVKDEMEIDIPLMSDPAIRGKTIPSIRGKDSLTWMKVIKRFRNATLVKCLLVTGRHHQIRAHLAAVGHPLLVDPMYNTTEEFLVSSIKKRFNLKKNEEEKPIISRVTMHSKEIAFVHPRSNLEMEFSSEYPKDFAALIQVLEKYSSID